MSRLKRWSLQVPGSGRIYRGPRVNPRCRDVPDNLSKLVAVVTRARVVSELSLVILA